MNNNESRIKDHHEIKVRSQYLFLKNIKKMYIGTNYIKETVETISNFTNKSNTIIFVKDITGQEFNGEVFTYNNPIMEYNKNVFIIVVNNDVIQNIRIPFWSIYYSNKYGY